MKDNLTIITYVVFFSVLECDSVGVTVCPCVLHRHRHRLLFAAAPLQDTNSPNKCSTLIKSPQSPDFLFSSTETKRTGRGAECPPPPIRSPSIDSLCSVLTRCSSDEPALPLINVSGCDGSVPPRRGRMWEPSYLQSKPPTPTTPSLNPPQSVLHHQLRVLSAAERSVCELRVSLAVGQAYLCPGTQEAGAGRGGQVEAHSRLWR